MKCKYCGAKGIKISHFMRKHKALMLRKMHRGRRKGSRGRKSSGGRGKSFEHSTGGAKYLTLTFHN